MRILLRSKRIHIDRRAARRQLDEFNGVWQSNCGWTPPSFDIRGVGNKRSDGRWPGEGSWPSPQSPKGFSAFLPLTQPPNAREKPKHPSENKGFQNYLRCKKSNPPGKFSGGKLLELPFALFRVRILPDNLAAALTAIPALAMFEDYSGRNLPSVRCPRLWTARKRLPTPWPSRKSSFAARGSIISRTLASRFPVTR
jgi:hypothetical protein